MIPQRHCIGRP